MKLCECGGDLLRHGSSEYKSDPEYKRIRYKCRECNKTFTVRVLKDVVKGARFFNSTGRPNKDDWRYALG